MVFFYHAKGGTSICLLNSPYQSIWEQSCNVCPCHFPVHCWRVEEIGGFCSTHTGRDDFSAPEVIFWCLLIEVSFSPTRVLTADFGCSLIFHLFLPVSARCRDSTRTRPQEYIRLPWCRWPCALVSQDCSCGNWRLSSRNSIYCRS